MTDKTGGPAFPHVRFDDIKVENMVVSMKQETETGMTLRDYFAAKAMQAIVSNADYDLQFAGPPERWPNAVAEEAYKYADAMLAESKK